MDVDANGGIAARVENLAGDDINGCPTILYDFYNEDKDVEYRYLAVMYQADDGNCQVFYLKDATATFYTFGGEPRTVKF